MHTYIHTYMSLSVAQYILIDIRSNIKVTEIQNHENIYGERSVDKDRWTDRQTEVYSNHINQTKTNKKPF